MKRVFSRIPYLVFAAVIALLVYALIAWIPLRGLLSTILFNPQVPFSANAIGSIQLLCSSLFDFSVWDALYSIFFSVLIGINAAMLIFYYRLSKALPSKRSQAAGIAGVIASILGFGCAACGSLFASTLVASIAGAGFAARLPLNGFEFQLVGFLLLGFSIFQLSRAINKPLVCPI